MKYKHLLIATALAMGSGALSAPQAIDESQLGLSKTGVFDVPTPKAPTYTAAPPGATENLPRAYPGAPPQIPHAIENLLPVTAKRNACLTCHQIKQKIPGGPTPIPKSHYVGWGQPKAGDKVGGRYFNCVTCHVPQAEAKPLVKNVF